MMYQHVLSARILLAIGVALLIISLVLGWISFSIPDWLQYYEHHSTLNGNSTQTNQQLDLTKFGLWYKCIFSATSNDFTCLSWSNHVPSFVRVVQVFIPFGLALGCLALLSACIGAISPRSFVTAILLAGLFAFLSFIFSTIGVTVFATESLVFVDRLRISNNESPRRWAMWLVIPHLVLAFLASICFIIASILNWCDYRSMQVTGILSHSVDKYGDNVFKAPSDSNMLSPMKKRTLNLQDYPNACYQVNGLANHQANPMQYPPPPSYPGLMNPAYQPTPAGLFGYSRAASPTMNMMYPHGNMDPYYPRHYMTEYSETEESPRISRTRHRSRSRRYSGHRSRSRSPRDGASNTDHHPKQTQFIPIPVPYYQPTATPSQPSNTHNPPLSYLIQHAKQQFLDENSQSTAKQTSTPSYATGQPGMVGSNSNQPVYTIAYRANNNGNAFAPKVISGPAAATYVTATRNSFTPEPEEEDQYDRIMTKQHPFKKININEAWAWRKVRPD